jgi:hypothetical protein
MKTFNVCEHICNIPIIYACINGNTCSAEVSQVCGNIKVDIPFRLYNMLEAFSNMGSIKGSKPKSGTPRLQSRYDFVDIVTY